MSKVTIDKASDLGKTPVVETGGKMERWISTAFREHSVIEKVAGKATAIKFQDYKLDLDLNKDEDRAISEALRRSPRFKRDLLVIGEKYPENAISEKSEMLARLQSMGIDKLTAILTIGELNKVGVPLPPTESDKPLLIAYILASKSM